MPGRGGAGNIIQAQEQSRKLAEVELNRTQDLEAQTPSGPPPTDHTPSTTSASQPQDYAHMGRGGAGNWYQPSELSKEGTFSEPSDSTAIPTSSKPQVSKPWHPDAQELPVARAGRGGAGNFVWKDEEKEKARKLEEQNAREKLSEGVEKDVEGVLQKPGAAMLGGVKAGRGW